MLETAIAGIVAAVVAGATAKLGEVASDAVSDAYSGLKALIIKKLSGKSGAVQAVEDDPQSESSQAVLAEAIAKSGAQNDPDILAQSTAVESAVEAAKAAGIPGIGDIQIGRIKAKLNVLIDTLVASGSISIAPIDTEGKVTVRRVHAGGKMPKKKVD